MSSIFSKKIAAFVYFKRAEVDYSFLNITLIEFGKGSGFAFVVRCHQVSVHKLLLYNRNNYIL